MRLGKAAGETVSTLSKCVIEVAAFPDVSGLGGHILCDVMVKAAFVSEGAFPVVLCGWEKSQQ